MRTECKQPNIQCECTLQMYVGTHSGRLISLIRIRPRVAIQRVHVHIRTSERAVASLATGYLRPSDFFHAGLRVYCLRREIQIRYVNISHLEMLLLGAHPSLPRISAFSISTSPRPQERLFARAIVIHVTVAAAAYDVTLFLFPAIQDFPISSYHRPLKRWRVWDENVDETHRNIPTLFLITIICKHLKV